MPMALRHRLAAEFIGTYALVFAGAGAVVITTYQPGSITHEGVAATFMMGAGTAMTVAVIATFAVAARAWAARFASAGPGYGLLAMRGTCQATSKPIRTLKVPAGKGLGGRVLLERRPIADCPVPGCGGPTDLHKYIAYGASPRASQCLVLGAKARALLAGRFHVDFADLKALVLLPI